MFLLLFRNKKREHTHARPRHYLSSLIQLCLKPLLLGFPIKKLCAGLSNACAGREHTPPGGEWTYVHTLSPTLDFKSPSTVVAGLCLAVGTRHGPCRADKTNKQPRNRDELFDGMTGTFGIRFLPPGYSAGQLSFEVNDQKTTVALPELACPWARLQSTRLCPPRPGGPGRRECGLDSRTCQRYTHRRGSGYNLGIMEAYLTSPFHQSKDSLSVPNNARNEHLLLC